MLVLPVVSLGGSNLVLKSHHHFFYGQSRMKPTLLEIGMID